jgi:hypothetical protein
MHKYLKQIIERDGRCTVVSKMECSECPIRYECHRLFCADREEEFFNRVEIARERLSIELKKALDA